MEKIILIIVASVNPAESQALNHYLDQINILYRQVDARPLAKYKVFETMTGEYVPNLVTIMEFKNEAALDSVFKSAAYKDLLPYREKAFSRVDILMARE